MHTKPETLMRHTLFGALVRPAMTAGVTFEYHALNLMISACAFIGMGNPLYGLMFIPVHVFGWLACRNDTAFFTTIYKRVLHLPPVPNQAFWGVRTYDPF